MSRSFSALRGVGLGARVGGGEGGGADGEGGARARVRLGEGGGAGDHGAALADAPHDVEQPDDVVVAHQLLQVHHLAKGALRVRGVAERVKALLQGHHVPRLLVDRLPHHAVGLRGGRAGGGARGARAWEALAGARGAGARAARARGREAPNTHALAQLVRYLVLLEHVALQVVRHCCTGAWLRAARGRVGG